MLSYLKRLPRTVSLHISAELLCPIPGPSFTNLVRKDQITQIQPDSHITMAGRQSGTAIHCSALHCHYHCHVTSHHNMYHLIVELS